MLILLRVKLILFLLCSFISISRSAAGMNPLENLNGEPNSNVTADLCQINRIKDGDLMCKLHDNFEFKNNAMLRSRTIMGGKVVRVTFVHYPPAMAITKLPDGTFLYSGTQQETLDYIAKALNINFQYIHVSQEEITKYGIGPSQFNPVVEGKADVAAFGIITTYDKFLILDISVPLIIEPHRIIVPWPKEESRLLAPIRPFHPLVWLCLGLSLIVLVPVLTFMTRLTRNDNDSGPRRMIRNRHSFNFEGLSRSFLFFLSHLTNHGYQTILNTRASYVIVGMWLLVTVVLANAYAGTLFSFLSVAKLQPVINSIEELANSKDVQLMVQARSVLAEHFLNAKGGPEKKLGDSLRANPGNMISSLKQIQPKLMTGSYAFPWIKLFTYGLIHDTYKANGNNCRVTFAKESVSLYTPVCFLFAKNGPYSEAINFALLAQVETGLLEFYQRKFIPRIDRCLMQNQKGSAKQKMLSLIDMSSAFVILAFGLSLSVLVFLIELIYKRVQRNYD